MGHSHRIQFEAKDFELLDLVLDLIPELRICALALKRARTKQVTYPLKSHREIIELLQEKELLVEGHRITGSHIERYMTEELFPITDERELISRVYLALCRCNEELAWAARAPKNAEVVLRE